MNELSLRNDGLFIISFIIEDHLFLGLFRKLELSAQLSGLENRLRPGCGEIEGSCGDRTAWQSISNGITQFLAAYKLRRGKKPSRDTHYLSNLPMLDKQGKPLLGLEAEGIDVPTAIEQLIRAMKSSNVDEVWPQFVARDLYEFLEEEAFGIEAMNQALKTPLANSLASGS